MRQRSKNRMSTVLLAFVLLVLGIGYAYLSTTLSINGTTDIDANNWDVYFDNINITSGSVTGDQVIDAPEVGNDEVSVSFHVRLKEPGEFFEFTVDAKNDGTIDAMIETIEKKLNGVVVTTLPAYLNYTVTYEDGTQIENNHLLEHESLETYKVRVEYRNDIDPSDLPSNTQNLSLSFGVGYIQSNRNAQIVEHGTKVYTVSNSSPTNIGQAIPDGVIQYSNAADAMAALRDTTSDNNIQFYSKHIIQNNVVTKTYIEFIVTPEIASANPGMTAGTYSLRGMDTYDVNQPYCKSEYYDSINRICVSPYNESNKETLLRAFGSSHCIEENSSLRCEVSSLSAYTHVNGTCNAGDGQWYCTFYNDGSSFCHQAMG